MLGYKGTCHLAAVVGTIIMVPSYLRQVTAAHFDGLVQERRNSIANAMELRLSCSNLLI